MANVRDSDTSLWLHNKLGTSNDSWTSGSICSQLNKEVLRNIRDCFSDMQTQVKLKLLLSFFHIPRRLVEEWKTELDDIIEVAGSDSELWVSMIAETIKTYPATGSLNTEISEFEETRPIFTDMVNDLKKLVNKHSDLGMLPLECQYLNKPALTAIVGQQNTPIKHFTLKRKPKSATLRSELLQKSADAQTLSLKKGSAPVIPLRSRGMPRKMTDTTPLKGIPSRMPTSGFKSPTSSAGQNATSQNSRPNISRPGRKDGGIKLLDITEQPLGYAQAKKRKKQQETEEQQKKMLEIQIAEKEKRELMELNAADAKANAAMVTETAESGSPSSTPTSTPDYAAGLNASSVVYSQPATPMSIKSELQLPSTSSSTSTQMTPTVVENNNKKIIIEKQQVIKVERSVIKEEPAESKLIIQKVTKRVSDAIPASITTTMVANQSSPANSAVASSTPAIISTMPSLVATQPQKTTIIYSKNSQLLQQQHSASASSLIAKISQQQQQSQPSGVTYVTTTTDTAAILSSLPKSVANTLKQSPVKITQTTIMQGPGPVHQNRQQPQTVTIQGSAQLIQSIKQQQQQNKLQRIQIQGGSAANLQNIPALTSISSPANNSTISLINNSQLNSINATNATANNSNFGSAPPPLQMQTSQGTKIVQIKTAPTNQQITNLQNLPPLIPTQSALKIQQAHQQLQQQQQQQAQKILVTTSQPSSLLASLPGQTTVTQHIQPQQQKFTQVMMQVPTTNASGGSTMKPGKAYILTAPNMLTQKAVLVKSVDADGNTVYQQIPIATTNMQDNNGMPGLIKSNQSQTVSVLSGGQMNATQQIPALVPTGQQQQQQLVIQQQPQQAGQTIIRPLIMSNSNQMQLPQGITLIQRPGQQPQLVQTISQPQQQQQQQTQQFHRVQMPGQTVGQIGQVQIRQQPSLIQIQQPQQQQKQQQQTVQIKQIQQPQQKLQMQQRPHQQIILTNSALSVQKQQPQQKTVQQRQNVTIVQQNAQQRGTGAQPARKLLSLSSEHVSKANEIFRKANKVTRPDKALILGFMGGCRENPRPTPENILVIKLSEREDEVKQPDNSFARVVVESHIKLDYNTGEWSTIQNTRRNDKASVVTVKDQKKEAKVA